MLVSRIEGTVNKHQVSISRTLPGGRTETTSLHNITVVISHETQISRRVYNRDQAWAFAELVAVNCYGTRSEKSDLPACTQSDINVICEAIYATAAIDIR